jgi:hypothetical protein
LKYSTVPAIIPTRGAANRIYTGMQMNGKELATIVFIGKPSSHFP